MIEYTIDDMSYSDYAHLTGIECSWFNGRCSANFTVFGSELSGLYLYWVLPSVAEAPEAIALVDAVNDLFDSIGRWQCARR